MRPRRFAVLAGLVLGLAALLFAAAQALPPVARAQTSAASFTVESTSFESNYPRGMTFTIQATSTGGDVTRATLFYELRTGLRERQNADFDPESGAWVARPYAERGGLPPWVDFHYTWLLTDAAGNTYETEPVYGVYADNTRDWWVVDTEYITLYWFGAMPELGDAVAQAMETMAPVFEAGWGRLISYKPLAILFPDDQAWNEYIEGGNNPNAAGFTEPSEGYTIQRILSERSQASLDSLRDRCGGYWIGPQATTPQEYRLWSTVHTIVHETTHLYQSDFNLRGPMWWTEGQPNFFAALDGDLVTNADGRMRAYAAGGYVLDSLQGSGPSSGSSDAPDGCRALEYAAGESFISFVIQNYGGLETHARIVANSAGKTIQDNFAEVTGVPFQELENQWRAAMGFPAVQALPTATPFVFPTAPAFSIPTPRPSSSGG